MVVDPIKYMAKELVAECSKMPKRLSNVTLTHKIGAPYIFTRISQQLNHCDYCAYMVTGGGSDDILQYGTVQLSCDNARTTTNHREKECF